jgi:hypothetical protein
MWIPYQSRSQSLILYRDVFYQRWVCSYMLLLMILRIDCYLIMLWWLGTMEEITMGLKRDVEVQRSSKGSQAKLESQSNSSWNPIRIPGTVRTKIVARSHTNSILYVPYMDGKIRGSTFQWNQSHIQIPSESTGNVKTMRNTESIMVLYYHILAPWAMYQVGPNRGMP